jgi:hypothetical protein
VAHSLGLDLILLKSVDGISDRGEFKERITGFIQTKIVDPCLIPYVLGNGVRTTILNGLIPERLELFLNGCPVTGTTIGF